MPQLAGDLSQGADTGLLYRGGMDFGKSNHGAGDNVKCGEKP